MHVDLFFFLIFLNKKDGAGWEPTLMFGVEFVQGLVGRIAVVGVVSAGFWNAVYFALKAVLPKSVIKVCSPSFGGTPCQA
jgi:hypothetical protein